MRRNAYAVRTCWPDSDRQDRGASNRQGRLRLYPGTEARVSFQLAGPQVQAVARVARESVGTPQPFSGSTLGVPTHRGRIEGRAQAGQVRFLEVTLLRT